MSMMNKRNTRTSLGQTAVSFNGNPQELKGAPQQLFELTVSHLYGKDTFYENEDARLKRFEEALVKTVKAGHTNFVANLIVYARGPMKIRSMPILLTCLFAKALRDTGQSFEHMRAVTRDVIQRADQITDMYAVALQIFGDKKKVPLAIKRGVADAFNKFNEYSFAKYNRDGAVKLKDVLRIVHPKGKDENQKEIFDRIMKDSLTVPYTWEVELSKAGQEGKSKSQVWDELVKSDKMGYMALLRNLRNITEHASQDSINHAIKRIENPEEVARSKQLPFRFVNAMGALEQVNHGNSRLHRAISRALDHSVSNIPQIGENVWIIVDTSGSMGRFDTRQHRDWNGRTQPLSPVTTACVLGAALAKASGDAMNCAVTVFSTRAKTININSDDSVMSTATRIARSDVGWGTDLGEAWKLKGKLGFEPDTVIILSDMQVNRMSGRNTSIFKKGCMKVAINLNAYDSTPVGTLDGWYQLAGWSERLFDLIPAMREGASGLQALSGEYCPMP